MIPSRGIVRGLVLGSLREWRTWRAWRALVGRPRRAARLPGLLAPAARQLSGLRRRPRVQALSRREDDAA